MKLDTQEGGDKGQLNSKRIYEVIVSPKMPTKIFPDFCPTNQTRIVAKKNCLHSPKKLKKIFDKTQNNDLFISPKWKNAILEMALKKFILSKLDSQMSKN